MSKVASTCGKCDPVARKTTTMGKYEGGAAQHEEGATHREEVAALDIEVQTREAHLHARKVDLEVLAVLAVAQRHRGKEWLDFMFVIH